MSENKGFLQGWVAPWVRVMILLLSLCGICVVSYGLTGGVLPKSPGDSLIFENALLLLVLGSAVLEYKFTKPADSMVNGLMGAVTLVGVYGKVPQVGWWMVFMYCSLVCVLAGVCVAVSSGSGISGWRRSIASITYRPAVLFGKARVLFSIVFLFAVFSFYSVGSIETQVLVLFWGVFVALWPSGLPEVISSWSRKQAEFKPVGRVVLTEAPNLVRVRLEPDTVWAPAAVKIYQQTNGQQKYLIPLFAEEHGDETIGTGLCAGSREEPTGGLDIGFVYDAREKPFSDEEMAKLVGGDTGSKLVGFVVENSTVEKVRFHTMGCSCCKVGMVVWCRVGDDRIYYQIVEGTTTEESLESNRHGFQVATACQLGTVRKEAGFIRYGWLPAMNCPVFAVSEGFGEGLIESEAGDFSYGKIPGTGCNVSGKFAKTMEYHTAILGITGSGKTELALDLVRNAVENGVKVFCIDLTRRYAGKLLELTPKDLSISEELSKELGEKLFDVETGTYGAGAEKKALQGFSKKLRDDIESKVKAFVESKEDSDRIGIVSLEEISNTKATIYITELFLTCVLNYAKDHRGKSPRILVVLEEAHTVIPEANTMGLGDYESKGVVAKICQIALQGRKYGVGLLVVAQRTATVSKTVLTQCNTLISFSCFDATSLEFLKNIFGETHIALIPNLPFLHAVVFGKGVRSERPVVIEVPFDEKKGKEKEEMQKAGTPATEAVADGESKGQ